MKSFLLKMDTEVYTVWKARAVEAGLSLSEWMRKGLNEYAKKHAIGLEAMAQDGAEIVGILQSGKSEVKDDSGSADSDVQRVPDVPLGEWSIAALGGRAEPAPRVAAENRPKGPTCKHGERRGHHCWQCGGLAVIEKEG
jgi:hypothetical protein